MASDRAHPADTSTGGELTLEQALRRLAQKGSVVRVARATDGRLPPRLALLRQGRDAGCIARAVFEQARSAALVEEMPGGETWGLSVRGRVAVRRLLAGGTARAVTEPTASKPGCNADESPLAWLRRRKGKTGTALITEEEFAAGERLRADFTFAQMGPRVTANWSAALSAASGSRRGAPGAGVEIADGVLAAGERVRRALGAVGPELSGILIDVCCHLKGLEDLERSAGWPQRSAKVVLQLALVRLARHYGIRSDRDGESRSGPMPRHWGTPDYRPAIESD